MKEPAMRAHPNLTRPFCAVLALAGAAALAAPAVAAPYGYETSVDEVVVAGPVDRDGPASLSRAVSYRDLDLNTYAGRSELKWRIRDTARSLCRDLDGPDSRACESEAIRNTRGQTTYAVAQARARSYYASLYDYGY